MPYLFLSIIAVGFAVFFGALWWRLMHQDRLRSAARVAALSNAIDDVTVGEHQAESVSVQPEFLAHERPVSRGSGLFRIAIGFGMAVLVVVAFAMLSVSRSNASPTRAAGAKSPSLELL